MQKENSNIDPLMLVESVETFRRIAGDVSDIWTRAQLTTQWRQGIDITQTQENGTILSLAAGRDSVHVTTIIIDTSAVATLSVGNRIISKSIPVGTTVMSQVSFYALPNETFKLTCTTESNMSLTVQGEEL